MRSLLSGQLRRLGAPHNLNPGHELGSYGSAAAGCGSLGRWSADAIPINIVVRAPNAPTVRAALAATGALYAHCVAWSMREPTHSCGAGRTGSVATKSGRDKPQVALVTGGSRGIGAATVGALAASGFDVAFSHHSRRGGGRTWRPGALPVRSDMTRIDDVRRLASEVARWAAGVDVLALNASGGLEADLVAADPDYPMRINRDAQLALLDCMLPLMTAGSVVVFITSHWAHLFGTIPQLPAYQPIAASKHAGEQALRARQAELDHRGIRLAVVTGDVVEGTITATLLDLSAKGLLERRYRAGSLPTPDDVARGVVEAATAPALPTGHTLVVGGPLDSV